MARVYRTAFYARPADVTAEWAIKIPGEHNRANVACAVAAARVLGVPVKVIRNPVGEFRGVEGRLQFVSEVNGIEIWNDNNATTPDAAIAALRALGGLASKLKKHIVLIMGGIDKGLDMSELVEEIPKYCNAAVLLRESGSIKLLADSLELTASEISNPNKLKSSQL